MRASKLENQLEKSKEDSRNEVLQKIEKNKELEIARNQTALDNDKLELEAAIERDKQKQIAQEAAAQAYLDQQEKSEDQETERIRIAQAEAEARELEDQQKAAQEREDRQRELDSNIVTRTNQAEIIKIENTVIDKEDELIKKIQNLKKDMRKAASSQKKQELKKILIEVANELRNFRANKK